MAPLNQLSKRALVKKEAELRSELDLTVHKIHFLLGYFALVKEEHKATLNEIHNAEMPIPDTD